MIRESRVKESRVESSKLIAEGSKYNSGVESRRTDHHNAKGTTALVNFTLLISHF